MILLSPGAAQTPLSTTPFPCFIYRGGNNTCPFCPSGFRVSFGDFWMPLQLSMASRPSGWVRLFVLHRMDRFSAPGVGFKARSQPVLGPTRGHVFPLPCIVSPMYCFHLCIRQATLTFTRAHAHTDHDRDPRGNKQFLADCLPIFQNENMDFQALLGVPGLSSGNGWLRLELLHWIHSSRGLGDLPKVIS